MSMEEAVDWVRRCPNAMEGDSEIEIRPLFETTILAPNSHPSCGPTWRLMDPQLLLSIAGCRLSCGSKVSAWQAECLARRLLRT